MSSPENELSPEEKATLVFLFDIEEEQRSRESDLFARHTPGAEFIPVFGQLAGFKDASLNVPSFKTERFQASVRRVLFPGILNADESKTTD